MTANIFDEGDKQRLHDELTLDEQRPREQARLPDDNTYRDDLYETARGEADLSDEGYPQGKYDVFLDGLLEALQRRL